jgi:hypothetical protein
MPSSASDLGERVASLAASFDALKNYEHERWHKLAAVAPGL